MDRREFLKWSAVLVGGTIVGRAWPTRAGGGVATGRFVDGGYPDPGTAFQHGVAAGDPLPDGMVLWTRVTTAASVAAVRWRVWRRVGAMTCVVAQGTTTTGPERDYTVHVDVRELEPFTDYWYDFAHGADRSRTGHFRTAPAVGTVPGSVRFGLVSCANFESGYFAAYRHVADRTDLDFVLCVGDYIYEYGAGRYDAWGPRTIEPACEIVTLAHYRQRYAWYRRDRDLQDLHANHAFVATLDDHEVANDSWSDGAENHAESDAATPGTDGCVPAGAEGPYAERKRVAYQAYLEWMPIRRPDTAEPHRVHRALRFGELMELLILDTRQYRSEPVGLLEVGGQEIPGEELTPSLEGGRIDDPNRTILGEAQRDWIDRRLAHDGVRWKVIGNQVMLAPLKIPSVPEVPPDVAEGLQRLVYPNGVAQGGVPLNVDAWDGYAADRRCVLERIAAERQAALAADEDYNVVFLTGDFHTSFACDLPLDPGRYPVASPSVAVELVGTSVTSANLDEIMGTRPRTTSLLAEQAVMLTNRHVRMCELDSHGFSVVDVTPERLRMDWWFLADRRVETSAAAVKMSAVVVTRTARVVAAAEPMPSARPATGRDGVDRCPPPMGPDGGPPPADGGPPIDAGDGGVGGERYLARGGGCDAEAR